jgi:hypothetical protein
MSQHIICYIPVIHTGYMELFAAHPGAVIHVLGTSVLTKRFDYLRKTSGAEPSVAAEIVRGTGRAAEVLEEDELADVLKRPNAQTTILATLSQKILTSGV